MSSRVFCALFLSLVISGCSSKGDGNAGGVDTDVGTGDADADTDTDTDTDADADTDANTFLVLTLSGAEVAAGDALPYTVEREFDDGTREAVSGHSLSSDIDDALADDGSALTVTLAGDHVITAAATFDGDDQTAEADLTVIPAAISDLDLTLADSSITAGASLGFSITGSDAYGNAVDEGDVLLSADSEDVTISGAMLYATVAGTYTLTASRDGNSDAESWTVNPGLTVAIDMSLDEEELEAGDSADVIVVLTDEWGNETTESWTVTVDGDGDATVDDEEVTFDTEGVFTVTVTTDDTALSESIEVSIDSNGPNLIVDTPARGSWTIEDSVDVTGVVTDAVTGVTSLTVNGDAVTPSGSGVFSHTVTFESGNNIIETVAQDGDTPDPNTTSDVRAVLQANEYWPGLTPMPDGVIMRLNEGDGGLGALAELAEGLISADAIGGMMTGEIFAGESCLFSWLCVSYSVDITDVTIGDVDIQLDTYSDELRAIVTISDVDVDGDVYATGVGTNDITLTVSTLTVTAMLSPSVGPGGAVSVGVTSVETTTAGLVFDAGGAAGVIESIVEFFGLDVDGLIEDELTTAVSDAVRDEIPALVGDSLESIEVSQAFPVGDNTYTMTATPTSVDVGSSYVDLSLETTFIPGSYGAAYLADGPDGSPYMDYAAPSFLATPGGTELGLGLDFFNQALRAFWAGGMLDTSLTDEDLGVDVAAIALVLPGLTDLTLVSKAMLPAVIVPQTDPEIEEELELQVGDLFAEIYNGEVSEENLYMQLYVQVRAPASLEATSAGDALSIELGDPVVYVDVVYPDPSSREAAGAEAAFEVLLPLFLPEITGAFGEVPIPSFEGFGLEDVETALDSTGSPDGYLVLSGDLSVD
jgi:hypothetical protein